MYFGIFVAHPFYFQEVKDLVSTLNVISNEKLQEEKAKDSVKSKGKKKRTCFGHFFMIYYCVFMLAYFSIIKIMLFFACLFFWFGFFCFFLFVFILNY